MEIYWQLSSLLLPSQTVPREQFLGQADIKMGHEDDFKATVLYMIQIDSVDDIRIIG